MPVDLDKVYGNDVIVRYKGGVTPERFTHRYASERINPLTGDPIPFDRIQNLLTSARLDIEAWYKKETGREKMDTLQLGDMLARVRERFWHDERFAQAFRLLGLDYETHHQKANLPWWSAVIAGELEHKIVDDDHVHVVFGPAHSFEVQMMRAGLTTPVRPASTDGLIVTSDGAPYAVIGVRGGHSYRNTYHLVAAGALDAPEGFKRGELSVYDVFREREITPELGIGSAEIKSAQLRSRNIEHLLSNGGVTYLFDVITNLTKDELAERWRNNRSPDKAEHLALVPLYDFPFQDIHEFIERNYRGAVANKQDRHDNERYLLHPAALDLAAHIDMHPSELRSLYREGTW